MEKEQITKLANLLQESHRTVFFSGAGISTESGVPDFRSPGGIWDRFDPDEMTFQRFLSEARCRQSYWELFRICWKEFQGVKPNPAHNAIAELDRRGKVEAVITQNVEGLHQAAGTDPEKVYELHGTMWEIRCLECHAPIPWEEAFEKLEAGEEIENCHRCGGLYKPATIAFGQSLPMETLRLAQEASVRSDLFVSIGSSLVVYPAARLPEVAAKSGSKLVIVNNEKTPLDSLAHLIIRGKAGEVMSEALREMGIW